jgi:transcriptional regulator with XRE-family HTH domain
MNIRRYRKIRALTQSELAEKIDISDNFLCNIENGNRWISPQTLASFAAALDIEPYELFKPENAPAADACLLVNKYADESVKAVVQALNTLRINFLDFQDAAP